MHNTYLEQYQQQELRKCQLKQLDILKTIDDICRRHDIDYWIDGGTLLGAVRHKGFIPWDDDIDIAMRQADMARFAEVARRELPDRYILQAPGEEGSKEPIAKIRDQNSFYVERGDDFTADYDKGLYVDVFPMVDYPTVSKAFVRRVALGISRSYSILRKAHRYSWRSVAELFWFGGQHLVYRALWAVACACRPHDTYISNITVNNGYGIMHRQDCIFPLSDIEFEGLRFRAPRNPDAYLSDLYHNYMDIPPVEKRKIHSVFIAAELIPLPEH